MFGWHDNGSRENLGTRVCLGLVLFLCLCVILQVLGVPVTLLNPDDNADALAASVLEGFSVPPTLPELALSSESVLLSDVHPFVHVPLLTSALFHPPIR